MDYKKHYDKLIERGKSRIIDGYKERHHIIPKCLGGDNSKSNLVDLTAEEHFVAHKLLILIYPGNKKLIWSAMSMTNSTRKMCRNNKNYGWLRREFVEMIRAQSTGKKHSLEARQRMSKSKTGVKRGPYSDQTKLKMSIASKGKKKSEKHIESMIRGKTGVKTGPRSEEVRMKISKSNSLTKRSNNWKNAYLKDPLYREGQSHKMKEIWRQRKLIKQ